MSDTEPLIHVWALSPERRALLERTGRVVGNADWVAVVVWFLPSGEIFTDWAIGSTEAQAHRRARRRAVDTSPVLAPVRPNRRADTK